MATYKSILISILLFLSVIFTTCRHSNKSQATGNTFNDAGEYYVIYNQNGKSGMLNRKGKVILPAQFDHIEDNSYDHLVLVDSGGHAIDVGDVVGYQFYKYGIVTDRGKILLRPSFDRVVISDKMILVKQDSLYGYLTDKGQWIVKPKFLEAFPFYKGAAVVQDKPHFTIIDKSGRRVINQTFSQLGDFKNGIASFINHNEVGFVNTKGKVIYQGNYDGIGDFNWYYGKLFLNHKTYLVDTAGKIKAIAFDSVETYEGKNHTTIAKGVIKGRSVEIQLR